MSAGPVFDLNSQLEFTAEFRVRRRGTVVAAGSKQVTVEAGDYADIEIGQDLAIVAGQAAGQTRRVTGLPGSNVVEIERAWTSVPDTTSIYETEPVLTDPTAITWRVKQPDDSVVTYADTDPEMTAIGLGLWRVLWQPVQAGEHWWRWLASGNIVQQRQGRMTIVADNTT